MVKPENIIIHVTQNAVNFISSTIGWIIINLMTRDTTVQAARANEQYDPQYQQYQEQYSQYPSNL